jgi:hypothetical protein
MKKKVLFQLFLFFILIFFIILFYFKYFSKGDTKLNLPDSNKTKITEKSENNLIKDMEYFSYDDNGNEYSIFSKFNEINSKEPEIIYMKEVTARINSVGSEPIIIKSDTAKYNNLTYDTDFKGNVILTNNKHKITSQNIELSFQKNLIWVYNDIVYNYLDTTLFADKVEIDLITKDSKIFMYDNNKVKIFRNN